MFDCRGENEDVSAPVAVVQLKNDVINQMPDQEDEPTQKSPLPADKPLVDNPINEQRPVALPVTPPDNKPSAPTTPTWDDLTPNNKPNA